MYFLFSFSQLPFSNDGSDILIMIKNKQFRPLIFNHNGLIC